MVLFCASNFRASIEMLLLSLLTFVGKKRRIQPYWSSGAPLGLQSREGE